MLLNDTWIRYKIDNNSHVTLDQDKAEWVGVNQLVFDLRASNVTIAEYFKRKYNSGLCFSASELRMTRKPTFSVVGNGSLTQRTSLRVFVGIILSPQRACANKLAFYVSTGSVPRLLQPRFLYDLWLSDKKLFAFVDVSTSGSAILLRILLHSNSFSFAKSECLDEQECSAACGRENNV